MEWLLHAGTSVTLTLDPIGEAKKLPGFTKGSLSLTGKRGETVQAIMDRFNTYRGPDNQITSLYKPTGERLPFSTVLSSSMVANVYASS